jgi:ubiquinone/menaquinone biosynthesis C-methylase UbiE
MVFSQASSKYTGKSTVRASKRTTMSVDVIRSIRRSYDQLADEYARRIFNELNYKPLDRELLDRFAAEASGHGELCDMGSGPGHVARYLWDAGTTVFGLDLSPKMLEPAGQLSPYMQFREGNMMALDLQEASLAGITAFYATVNIPKESLLSVFREMRRVLRPGGLLLLAFHTGDEALHKRNCGEVYFHGFLSGSAFRYPTVSKKLLGLWWKRRSNVSHMLRKWSTRAEGLIFLRGNPAPFNAAER